jgi:hypothetical protein
MFECVGDILDSIGLQVGQCRNEWLMLMVIASSP